MKWSLDKTKTINHPYHNELMNIHLRQVGTFTLMYKVFMDCLFQRNHNYQDFIHQLTQWIFQWIFAGVSFCYFFCKSKLYISLSYFVIDPRSLRKLSVTIFDDFSGSKKKIVASKKIPTFDDFLAQNQLPLKKINWKI